MGRIQTGSFDNLIRRLYSIKGGGSELSESLGDVFPILDLENLPAELLLLRGWRKFSAFATQVAVAAQTTALQLVVPDANTNLVVVEKLIIKVQTASNVTIGTNVAAFTELANVNNQDTRSPEASNAHVRLAGTNNAATTANGAILRLTTGVDREFEVPGGIAVLGPGGVFSVIVSTGDLDLTVSFFGRERIAEPSEVSF